MASTKSNSLRSALRQSKFALAGVAMISALLNILALGGPIYLLLVYDSVMPSGSRVTLFGLLALVTIIYLFQGLFEILRSRILADIGAALDARMTTEVQRLISAHVRAGAAQLGDGLAPMRDLDKIRAFLAGPGPGALMDLPWMLLFLGLLTLLHVWLGITALVGVFILVALAILNHHMGQEPSEATSVKQALRARLAQDNRRHAEIITALGMEQRMLDRWKYANIAYNHVQNRFIRIAGTIGAGSRVFRLFLQSLVLTVGALLYLVGEASGGIVFAASILAARALAPIDQAIANWRGLSEARQGWTRLETQLAEAPIPLAVGTSLPRPKEILAVEQVAAAPPGAAEAVVSGVDFTATAGDALGIIGPSAAGKTTLAKTLIGLWPPMNGAIRLDGASLSQWEADDLGASLGYLPQQVELLDGTIAENIARFATDVSSENIIEAARAADVHEMILQLEKGYDTPIGPDGCWLSAGQRQRIGLARALFGDPFLIVLDEPSANLDGVGEVALDRAIAEVRKRGGLVVLIAHRPSTLRQVNKVLVLKDGRMAAFGDRDDILNNLRNLPEALPHQSAILSRTKRAQLGKPMDALPAISAIDLPHDTAATYEARAKARIRIILASTCALLFGLVLSGALIPIGGAVIAPGQVALASGIKRIAHPTGGVIARIHVDDGDRVAAGAPLVQLDTRVSALDAELSEVSLDRLIAQRARLIAEIEERGAIQFPAELRNDQGDSARSAMQIEMRQFRLNRSERAGLVSQLDERINQLARQIDGFRAQRTSLQAQRRLIRSELEGLRTLNKSGYVTIRRLNEMERTAVELDGSIGAQDANIAQAGAAIAEAREQRVQIARTARARAGDELARLNGAIDEKRITSSDARATNDQALVRSPASGVVDKIAFAAAGEVVRSAETIMEIVPDRDLPVFEAYVSPADIDRVQRGQKARVRLSAFDAASTPELDGRVVFVSADALTNETTGMRRYRVRIELDSTSHRAASTIGIVSGMPAEIFIETGDRSMLSYLTKPLSDQFARAFRD